MEIAVISGKGGTGKSSISSAFVSVAKSAVVVDCDVDASNLYLLFSPLCKEEEAFVSGSHDYSRSLAHTCPLDSRQQSVNSRALRFGI